MENPNLLERIKAIENRLERIENRLESMESLIGRRPLRPGPDPFPERRPPGPLPGPDPLRF